MATAIRSDNSGFGTDRKLFAGPRVRRLRSELGLTQTRMAEDLGVSISYLNLIERNQRPVTAQFLLRLAEVFAIDLRTLTNDASDQMLGDVAEAISDQLFRGLDVPRVEIQDSVQSTPGMAQAFVRLYSAYRDLLQQKASGESAAPNTDSRSATSSVLDQVRDIIQDRNNHFATLDVLAESLSDELRLTNDDLLSAARERLREKHLVSVRILPVEVMPDSLRRYDHHRKQLQLSELLDGSARLFQTLVHLASCEARVAIDDIVRDSGLEEDATKRLLRVNLANYFAAAVMMPYARFHSAAEQTGYDLTLLMQRFGGSFEQVCHRLTTLQRPTMRGIPFFLIRVDQAGNVSKRFSAGRFPFSKYGGTCPLWHIHAAFRTPAQILRQTIEMPDGSQYFSLSRTVRATAQGYGEAEPQFALGLGCDIKQARHLVYARGLDLTAPNATPIGVNCALCPRDTCRQRSAPPINARLIIDERVRGPNPFPFAH
jgi:XRE family transcriptional regulator, fatty acid utilization regulator